MNDLKDLISNPQRRIIIDSEDKYDEIIKTICSYLNTKGGSIILQGHESLSVAKGNVENFISFIRKKIENKITPNLPLFSTEVAETKNGIFIIIEVPEGYDKPYVYNGTIYLLKKKKVTNADAFEIRDLVQEKSIQPLRWERRVSLEIKDNDFNEEILYSCVSSIESSGRHIFEDNRNIRKILSELSLYKESKYTNAADVIFGKRPELRSPQIRVKLVRFKEDKESDAYIDDKIVEGNIFNILSSIEQFIKTHINTSVEFSSESFATEDQTTYPHDAIREGIVNALAHRDYESTYGGVSVLIYPHRLEIWNSGHFPKEIKISDLKKKHPSIPRNPDIVNVLYLYGRMNRIGRGTQNIINSCIRMGLPSPKWIDTSSGVTLTIYSRTRDTAVLLNERQIELLKALKPRDEITSSNYHQDFASFISIRQARRDLVKLEELGYIELVGAGAGARYRKTNRTLSGHQ